MIFTVAGSLATILPLYAFLELYDVTDIVPTEKQFSILTVEYIAFAIIPPAYDDFCPLEEILVFE